ncbi:UNVERIFIED_CONTAM: hypothetical protein GTU68_014793 [Idotea baltica]
MLTIR